MKPLSFILILMAAISSCECSESSKQVESPRQSQRNGGERIEATRNFLEKERESIQAYIKDRDMDFERTGTGLHYKILHDSSAVDSVTTEDIVEFEYDIFMMNGELLYSSDESGRRQLRVDKEDAEIGVHESLKKLGLGDKGLFILPSHLAFGVAGDQHKVPPMTPLVYEIKVVNIRKS